MNSYNGGQLELGQDIVCANCGKENIFQAALNNSTVFNDKYHKVNSVSHN